MTDTQADPPDHFDTYMGELRHEVERLRASNKQLRVALEAAQDMAINAREPFGSPRFVSNNDPRWVQIADALEYAALKDAQGDKT